MKRAALIITILAIAFTACSKEPAITALDRMSTQELIAAAQYTAEKALTVYGRKAKKRKKQWATEGKQYANRCIEISPKTPECYYWRAVNTGLYYSVKVRGYQKGIKQMIADCEQVMMLGKQGYDHAGPYRIIGEIYTKLPQTTGRPDSIPRDLEKGETFLRKAVEIAPDYPENHIALAENLYIQDRFDESLSELMLAKSLAPNWRIDYSYPQWKKSISKLEKKLKRKTK